MNLKKGERVKHLIKPDWGIGEVLENTTDGYVRVLFDKAGEKKISMEQNFLEVIPLNLQLVVNEFLTDYPDGFSGEKYLEKERNYKLEAHDLSVELLDKSRFKELIEQQDYKEVCKRALQLCNKTNLIYPNEKMALKDGLTNENSKRKFSESLFYLLYGTNNIRDQFEKFSETLREINAAKWTIATYFLFIRFPEKHMFLKPKITRKIADLFRFDIFYDSKLNWKTYSKTLEFANSIKDILVEYELKPRDMIDVQSFIWCVTPHY